MKKPGGKAGTTQKKPTGGYRPVAKGREGRAMSKGTVVEKVTIRHGRDRTLGRDAGTGKFLARNDEHLTPVGENNKRFSVVEARSKFSEVINKASYGKERIILTRQGKDSAALISVEDLILFDRLLEEEQDRLDIEEAERRLSNPAEAPIPYEQARRGLNIE